MSMKKEEIFKITCEIYDSIEQEVADATILTTQNFLSFLAITALTKNI